MSVFTFNTKDSVKPSGFIFCTMFVYQLILLAIISNVGHGYLGCEDPLIPCRNKTHCVPVKDICVKYFDCDDGSGKRISCHPCLNTNDSTLACVTQLDTHITFECLSPHQICDNKINCLNHEDEHNCGKEKCAFGQWLCPNGRCIHRDKLCDHHNDCLDSSDEDQTTCNKVLCGGTSFYCPHEQCIPWAQKCNGVRDCADGSDELHCNSTVSTSTLKIPTIKDSCALLPHGFECSTSQTSIHSICIPADRVCDGYRDCPMGDDEIDCQRHCQTNEPCLTLVNVTCLDHPQMDSICRCRQKGYRLTKANIVTGGNLVCRDYDECRDSFGQYCSYQCENLDGGFSCLCPQGFTFDNSSNTCRTTNSDLNQPNLLILFDQSIHFEHLGPFVARYDRLSFSYRKIEFRNKVPTDRFQYDHEQSFILYYDRSQRNLVCHSQRTFQTVILLSDVNIDYFVYDSDEKNLFTIDKLSQTLNLSSPITCDHSFALKKHSWPLIDLSQSIRSMELDSIHGKIIFATEYQFLIANISEPNVTRMVHQSERPIQRFIYDSMFERIFWTASNITSDELYPVYTCDKQFQQCHDTFIRLPTPWPMGFLNDSLIYVPLSGKSIESVQLYGKDRFSTRVLTTTRNHIRSLLQIDPSSKAHSDLCTKNGTKLCKNAMCLLINQSHFVCVSVDDVIRSSEIFDRNNAISLFNDNVQLPVGSNSKKKTRSIIATFFSCLFGGILIVCLIIFGKRFYRGIHQKLRDHAEQRQQNEQRVTMTEPILDEFNVIGDDRHSDRLPLTNQLHY